MITRYHEPVLLEKSIEGLAIKPEGIYVDATYGGGGHAKEILKKLGKNGRLLAFDSDSDAMKNRIDDERLMMINHNYRYLKNYLKYYQALPVDGILADLGVSSFQIDNPERGFSTRFDSALDLRMDRRKSVNAQTIVNNYATDQLADIFRNYGELENANKIAEAIIRERTKNPIRTTGDLKRALQGLYRPSLENKFFARVFQALRIEVNKELEALSEFLMQSLEVLRPGGRLVVISYHSLEDRMVKNFMKTGNLSGVEKKDPLFGGVYSPFILINRRAIVAEENEIRQNNRARSARMRIAEKK